MRVLIADDAAAPTTVGTGIDDSGVARLYTHDGPLLRLNFVATLDGAATGRDGLSGTINSAADHRAFLAMRRAADALLVGAGTVRAEQYGGANTPMVIVSNRPEPPQSVRGTGAVLATTASSGATASETVWICGQDRVDLPALIERVRATFGPHLLCEGGPTLAAELVALGVVDELALSWTPHLVGGQRTDHPRLLDGPDVDATLNCRHLLEEDGTLLGLWRLAR